MKFVIDVFGGDNSPQAIIKGCVDAMLLNDDFTLILCGDEQRIREDLSQYEYDASRVEIVHAPDIISCDEQPTVAIKRKKESSLVKALQITADGGADCFISAGSTGAVLAGATLIVKRIPGIKRPALAPILPTLKGPVMLIDCGANVDCKSEYLEQFAIMGSAYMKNVLGIEQPRVGLINNGAEPSKGNELTKEVYKLLEKLPCINFAGNCEAREVMSGDFDVLVCDGFVGNAVLKALEGTAGAIMTMLKEELMSRKRSKFGAMFCRKAFRALKKKLDYTEYGGAPMLGINGGIIKAHGSSDARAICSAIGQARMLVLGDITNSIAADIQSENETES
ncbi:MAG: phosphate acyltransferase PlsX [Clostridia bacterium]|nr:phosphate acyltransferase PlsX [Clostridia bacterium]